MTIEEELKQAVVARNAKRKAKREELPKYINEFLGNTLAKAIAEDEAEVNLSLARKNVSDTVWDELNNYCAKDINKHYRKNLVDLIVDDVYKPYLSDYSIFTDPMAPYYYSNTHITFYINQD